MAERDMAFIFFASFALISQQSPLKKKLWTLRSQRSATGSVSSPRRWGKETHIGEGMGGELRVREKNTLHALQEHKTFTLDRD